MSELIEEISEMWEKLLARRDEVQIEYNETSFKATKLSIELNQVNQLIKDISPISSLEKAHDYLRSLQGSAK
jgi:hypothetical protein